MGGDAVRARMYAERAVEAVDLAAELSPEDMERVTDAIAAAFQMGWHARADVRAAALVDRPRRPRKGGSDAK